MILLLHCNKLSTFTQNISSYTTWDLREIEGLACIQMFTVSNRMDEEMVGRTDKWTNRQVDIGWTDGLLDGETESIE